MGDLQGNLLKVRPDLEAIRSDVLHCVESSCGLTAKSFLRMWLGMFDLPGMRVTQHDQIGPFDRSTRQVSRHPVAEEVKTCFNIKRYIYFLFWESLCKKVLNLAGRYQRT